MDNNKKNFNRYIFLSTFSRNLIEVFIGTILLKKGYILHDVIFYYLLMNIFSTVLTIPCIALAKRYSNKLLSMIGVFSFILLQLFLNFATTERNYLYIIAFLFALYRRGYWIARRYYTLQVIDDKKNVSKMFSVLSIINQISIIISSYVGSLLLQFLNINIITIISIMLLAMSLYFLFKVDYSESEKNDIKIKIFEMFKCIPKSSILHIACFELQYIIKLLLPLYIVLYVKDTYTAIGGINLIVNIATLVFVYLYGRLINNDRNYLRLSVLLVIIIRIIQINTSGILLMIVSFMEGFISKMYDQSFNKNSLILSKKFEFHNYNFMYETIQNISRLVVFIVIYLFIPDIKNMIYFTLFFISLCLLINFKLDPSCDESYVIWKN